MKEFSQHHYVLRLTIGASIPGSVPYLDSAVQCFSDIGYNRKITQF
jgi:hypothetical protein